MTKEVRLKEFIDIVKNEVYDEVDSHVIRLTRAANPIIDDHLRVLIHYIMINQFLHSKVIVLNTKSIGFNAQELISMNPLEIFSGLLTCSHIPFTIGDRFVDNGVKIITLTEYCGRSQKTHNALEFSSDIRENWRAIPNLNHVISDIIRVTTYKLQNARHNIQETRDKTCAFIDNLLTDELSSRYSQMLINVTDSMYIDSDSDNEA